MGKKIEFGITPRIERLAKLMRTSPMYVADFFGISPIRIEELLVRRGQYKADDDSIDSPSIIDAVRKYYGKEAANLCLKEEM